MNTSVTPPRPHATDCSPPAARSCQMPSLLHITWILAKQHMMPLSDFIVSLAGSTALLMAQFAFLGGLDTSGEALRYLVLARTAFAFSGGQDLERFLIDSYMDGSLMMDAIAPPHPFTLIGVRALAAALVSAASTLPGVLTAAFIFGGLPSLTPARAALYTASILLVWLAATGISLITSSIGISLRQGEAAVQLRVFVTQLASGALIPVYLYPEWAQELLRAFPFVHLADTPVAIALGEGVRVMYPQIAWSLILFVAGAALWRRRFARLDIYGR